MYSLPPCPKGQGGLDVGDHGMLSAKLEDMGIHRFIYFFKCLCYDSQESLQNILHNSYREAIS